MYAKKLFCLCAVVAVVLAACSTNEEDAAEAVETSSTRFALTQAQQRLADIKTGALENRLITSVIRCTGEIDVPPEGRASVSALQGGFIRESTLLPGAYVKRGQILARLANPDYITLQQAYLETLNELRFAEQEYNRQKMLGEQNATAVKNLQQSESAYHVLKGRLAGMKARLELLGVGIKSLEDGHIQPVINLRAPINGYITAVNHFLGEFVESRDIIFQIVNMDELHFELNVFEQDIAKISRGQTVMVRPAGANRTYSGKVFLVSPQRNPEERTFSIHGHFNEHGDELKPGMFVEADILLSADSLLSVPEKAVVFQEGEPHVVVAHGGSFELQPVETGGTMDGWIEIKNAEELHQKEIVIEGASRLFAAMKRSE